MSHDNTQSLTISSALSSGAPTMSSREIADICEARHNDVVATIERLFENGVLRESRKTTRIYRPEKGGRPTAVYDLTKRDTLVVVSGYNDDVRAKIIDRWMELETSAAPASQPKAKRVRKTPFDTAFRRCMNVAALLPNLDENQRLMMAARGTYELTGVNPLELLGATSLPAPVQEDFLTPTEIGKRVGLSGQKTNEQLRMEGYQVRDPGSSSGCAYKLTEKGLPFARFFDTTRRGGKGAQQQLKWSERIVDLLGR